MKADYDQLTVKADRYHRTLEDQEDQIEAQKEEIAQLKTGNKELKG